MSKCTLSICAALALLHHAAAARACGCFAMSSPATPVVQAGERILFAHDGNAVIAYIQIQYQGSASDFGWLVPLPAVPTLDIGTDELFTTLGRTTQPSYQLTTSNLCTGGSSTSDSSGGGCGASFADNAPAGAVYDLGFPAADLGHMNPVVVQSSIGPYDYAVLHADDQSEMLNWLQQNRYFVPDGTGQAVAPYIHPGGYFLALKLHAGESAGDIVPVILRYQSDLPMIPITLTQVGAIPNMGILVWELGQHRAIPRNYHHTVLDELPIWFNTASYASQVTAAVLEADKHHSFITEYAGTSAVMRGQLYYPGRFGSTMDLAAFTSPADYLDYLSTHGFTFDTTLYSILSKYIPEPDWLVKEGIPLSQFYSQYRYYSGTGYDLGEPAFDAAALTNELDLRIIQPTIKSSGLFDQFPYLTRLYTMLSPADMNADPVFSENPDLPDVPLVHSATLSIPCSGNSWLTTDQNFQADYEGSFPPPVALPASLRIETLREAGPAQIDVDNGHVVTRLLAQNNAQFPQGSTQAASYGGPRSEGGGCACDVGRRRARADVTLLFLAVGAFLSIRRLRRFAMRG